MHGVAAAIRRLAGARVASNTPTRSSWSGGVQFVARREEPSAMNNLKISTRLLLLIGMLSLLLGGIGGIGLLGIAKSNEALRSVYEDRSIPLEQIADIQKRLLENRLAISNSLLDASPEQIAANTATVDANIAAISKLWETFSASALTPPQQAAAKTFADQRKRFVQEGL